MFPTRYTNLGAARVRFGDRVDRLGVFLDRVDEKADAVVEAIEGLPPGRGWQMYDRALSHGISAVPDAPAAFKAIFAEVEDVPAWVDDPTLDRGGALLMRAGLLGGLVLGAKSLVHGYASPGGNKPLVFSGRLREQAARRLNETARFVQAVCRPGGMRRFGDGFQITMKVRLMHAQVRRMLLRSPKWDARAWGAPVNQHDMAGTTLLFSYSVLEGLRTFGVRIHHDEAAAYMQLWRWVGYVIGVDPKILPTSEFDAHQLAELIDATMGAPDDDSRALVVALMEHPVKEAKTDAMRMLAERQQVPFAYGVCRGLIGDELADALAVPRNGYRYAVPVMRAITTAAEMVRDNVSAADRTALSAGMKYWDRVVEVGLAGATAEFRLPEKLAYAT